MACSLVSEVPFPHKQGQGAVEVLAVQVPYLIQDRSLHVYAVKNLDIDGFSVTVRTDSVYIDSDDIRPSQPPRGLSSLFLPGLNWNNDLVNSFTLQLQKGVTLVCNLLVTCVQISPLTVPHLSSSLGF